MPRVSTVVALLGALWYAAWVRDARRQCDGAVARGLREADEITRTAYAEYADCAFDAALEGGCAIPRAAAGAFAAASTQTDAPHATRSRTTEIATTAWCAAIESLPDPLAHLGVFAAAALPPMPVVISRDRLRSHEETLAAFRRQCDCGWPWWRHAAHSDHKVSYEFTRTGLVADAILAEIRRAGPFYARFGGAVDTWIASVNRPGGDDQIMSDHGMLLRETTRHVTLIVRYILVVYSAPRSAPSGDDDDGGGGSGETAPSLMSRLWNDRGASASAVAPAATAVGTFTLCMSEVQITTWPAVPDCDCVLDSSLHQRMRETVDARMKKHFADSAPNVLRAVQDTFGDDTDNPAAPPPLRALPRGSPAAEPPRPPQPLSSLDTL